MNNSYEYDRESIAQRNWLYGGWVQTISTIGKLIPIALIIVFGLWKGNNDILGIASGAPTVEISLGAAILATLWAYDGWMLVGFVAGEMKNPAKMLPRAIRVLLL